ncbi:hypothetical protein BASA83_002344 [Batrachochytrium salamandrivorans]|nr:hypothetical protein BASA83_002344 [Batrachochytrium salamandrivorans]
MHRTYIPSLGQSPNWPAAMWQANHASSAKFLRSAGPHYWPGHRGLSPLTGPLWWPMGLSLGHSRQVSCTPQQQPRPAGQSQSVYTLSCSLGLQAHGPLGGRIAPTPLWFFARVDTQLLQSINDTRVQIFDCTLHTTTTTTITYHTS